MNTMEHHLQQIDENMADLLTQKAELIEAITNHLVSDGDEAMLQLAGELQRVSLEERLFGLKRRKIQDEKNEMRLGVLTSLIRSTENLLEENNPVNTYTAAIIERLVLLRLEKDQLRKEMGK